MKALEFENKVFGSQKELFTALKANKGEIISLKTAAVKDSEGISFATSETKGIDGLEKGFIYPIINTTKYLDSHGDVHLDGIWNKSISEQQNKVYYIEDHTLKMSHVIAYPEDVEMSLKNIQWKDLGRDYSGATQALVFKIAEKSIVHADALKAIKENRSVQNSVRMQYVKIDLAINSDDDEFKEELAVWEDNIEGIANKDLAIKRGYFWAVKEAKIYKEGSMVLFGSNDVTPTMRAKDTHQPSDDTTEPLNIKAELDKHTLLKGNRFKDLKLIK